MSSTANHGRRRFLIAGLGSAGRRHLANFRQLGHENIVLYRVRGGPAAELSGLEVFTDLRAALDTKPDVVVVANPTSLHLDVALAAVERGCHVFVEKPLSHTWDRVEHLLELARQRSVVGTVGYQLRFHPALRRVKEMLAEGLIGRPLYARIEYAEYLPDWHPWEDYRLGYSARRELGGGPILTLSHTLDLAYWLFGMPQRVTCVADKVSDLEVDTEDLADIVLAYRGGPTCSVHVDYVRTPPRRGLLDVVGQLGTLRWSDETGQVDWYDAARQSWRVFPSDPALTRNEIFLAELRDYLECVGAQRRPAVTLENAAAVLEIALAAQQSATTGSTVHLTQSAASV